MTDIILSTQNGEPVASSRQIAESFGKEHKNVMQAVANLAAENSAAKSMFYETTFENRGKQYPMYLMKRSDYNMPTQRAVEQGLFEIKETTVVHSDGHTSINKTPKVTGKGQIYFVNLFLKGRAPAGRLREGWQNDNGLA